MESSNPHLYEMTEWAARRAVDFWATRAQQPPTWRPLTHMPPTPGDQDVYNAFGQIWATDRDEVSRAFFADLERRRPTVEEFLHTVAPGSAAFITIDRFLCAYDQAGTLIKNGILHPTLFFRSWRSPAEIWAICEPWVVALREVKKAPHLYDNIDWLVAYQHEIGRGDDTARHRLLKPLG